ncbi:MAG: hypothetical protein R2911_07340 [Caldilineaceae bacterium]
MKAFVQITRYPFQTLGREVIGEGLRGAAGSGRPMISGASPPRIMPGLPTRGR